MARLQIDDEGMLTSYQATLASLVALVTFAVSISVIIGWHVGAKWLVSSSPGLPVLAYDTAVFFLLSSFALSFAVFGWNKVATVFCGVILLNASAFIIEAIVGHDLGFSRLFFEPSYLQSVHEGTHVSPLTSACFILFVLAILSIMYKQISLPHIWLPGLLCSVILVICIVGLFGYGHVVTTSQQIYIVSYTILGIILLCIGLLLFATSLVSSSYPKSIQIWVSVLVTIAILIMVTIFYISFSLEDDVVTRKDIEYESSDVFEFLVERISEVVNETKRSHDRLLLPDGFFDKLWEADARNYKQTLPGFEGMLVVDKNDKVLKETHIPGYPAEDTLPTLLLMMHQSKSHFFTLRSPSGRQVFAIRYPLKEGETYVTLFDVETLIQVPHDVATITKFDFLLEYGNALLCNTFMYTILDKSKDYESVYYETKIAGKKFKAYFWPQDVFESSYRKMLPLVLLACGGLLAHFVGFLFYLIQKFKELGQQLDVANNAKTMFLANVSHEVRTPLHGIIATVSMMKNMDLPAKQQRYAHIIDASAHHLLNLINNLLDLTKIESNSFNFVYQPCDIKQNASETLQMLSVKAQEKNLDIEFNFRQDPSIHTVKIPIQAFTQILVNLLGNALKFTDKGKVSLSIDVARNGDKGLMNITVKDTGLGIAKDRQKMIFDKFSQSDNKLSIERGGTGLGLFLTKVLVEQLNGKIWFESTLGAGSTFHVEIPVELLDG